MKEEIITDNYAIYRGDCIEKMPSIPNESIHMSVYSPPFASLYTYSSFNNDLGNCRTYKEFLEHYEYVIKETHRITLPGRMTCVHCMDLPTGNSRSLIDFPGDIIRIHEKIGFHYWDRHSIWKEPLMIAIRTRQVSLRHNQIAKDSSECRGALPDYLLIFKKKGKNKIPITHPLGFTDYAGDVDLLDKKDKDKYLNLKLKYINWKNDKTNRLSQWIWRRYASSNWLDVRANRMLEYKPAKDEEDERHVCPLHLDIIERCLHMWSNPKETIFTPFMGIGSEVYEAVSIGRKGIGIELKPSYFKLASKNLQSLTRSLKRGKTKQGMVH